MNIVGMQFALLQVMIPLFKYQGATRVYCAFIILSEILFIHVLLSKLFLTSLINSCIFYQTLPSINRLATAFI